MLMLRRLLLPGLLLCGLVPLAGPARANREPPPASVPAGAGAAGAVDTKIKIVPKPVPCVPCPCECPDVRGPGQTAASAPVGTAPYEPAEAGQEKSERAERHPSRPAVEPPEVRPPPPARGLISGSVVVRDRGGKEKSDNSDVVIYIEKVPRRFAALKRTRKMAQRDKTFTPRVLAVTKGSTVEFPNEDKFFHNVFSLSEGNTFDLGLYRAGTSKSVTFDRSGVVDVYCNIHPNMWAQILVLDNPYYAVTGKEGAYEIPKVPPGTYTLAAWVSGGEPVRQQVRVEAGGRTQVKFELREGQSSKPHLNKFNQPYGRYK